MCSENVQQWSTALHLTHSACSYYIETSGLYFRSGPNVVPVFLETAHSQYYVGKFEWIDIEHLGGN